MTPENDLTLRGLFRPHTRGVDEWNDVRDYRNKYGVKNAFLGSINLPAAIRFHLSKITKTYTILHERPNPENEYEQDMYMYDRFPGSKVASDRASLHLYGYMGAGDMCDCCGVELHIFNKTPHYMCIECSAEHQKTIERRAFF